MTNTNAPKHFYVPWEGYTRGNEPEGKTPNDRLCLQGPHTRERAHEIAAELRAHGLLASVIDCSETFKQKEILLECVRWYARGGHIHARETLEKVGLE